MEDSLRGLGLRSEFFMLSHFLLITPYFPCAPNNHSVTGDRVGFFDLDRHCFGQIHIQQAHLAVF